MTAVLSPAAHAPNLTTPVTPDHRTLLDRLEAWRAHDTIADRELADQVLRADGWVTEAGINGSVIWQKDGEPKHYRRSIARPHPVNDFVAARAMLPDGGRYSLSWNGTAAIAVVWPTAEGRDDCEMGTSPAEPVALLIAIFRCRVSMRARALLGTCVGAA